MRLNRHGVLLYEVGDQVQLTDERPDNWNSSGEMDQYLSQVVTITAVRYSSNVEDERHPRGVFTFDGGSAWTFRTDEIATMATPELLKQAEEQRAIRLAEFNEKFKTFLTDPKAIYEIAKDIFGEQYVDLRILRNTEFNIFVHFPEVNITNSRRHRHVIKDLYVKINVDLTNVTSKTFSTTDQIAHITISGWRGSLSDEEYQSQYSHSHFSGNGIERWSDFCLGSSDFAMILQTMKFSITPEDWTLLFLSLENYVSWESLEGGPYKMIQSVSLRRETVNTSNFRNHALELAKNIPSAALSIVDGRIDLIEDHPALLEHYTNNTRIKSFENRNHSPFNVIRTRFDSHVSREGMTITFKDRQLKTTLYRKNAEETEEEGNIEQAVINFYNETIKQELKKYTYYYEYNKISTSSALFRASSPF